MPGRPSTRTKAIVLARTKLGEQDLILTLLTESGAQLRAVAKGDRKPGGRLASRVELFSETDFLVAHGRSLGIVTEAQLTCPHERLRGDLPRVAAASAVAEVARLTSYEDVEDRYLMPICSRALRACEEAPDQAMLDLVVAAYAFKVLSHAGWRPELDACIACGDPVTSHFSVQAGGLLCASCAKDVEGTTELAASEVAWLRALIGLTFDELLALEPDPALAALLVSLAHGWSAAQLDARLRAWEFMLAL